MLMRITRGPYHIRVWLCWFKKNILCNKITIFATTQLLCWQQNNYQQHWKSHNGFPGLRMSPSFFTRPLKIAWSYFIRTDNMTNRFSQDWHYHLSLCKSGLTTVTFYPNRALLTGPFCYPFPRTSSEVKTIQNEYRNGRIL